MWSGRENGAPAAVWREACRGWAERRERGFKLELLHTFHPPWYLGRWAGPYLAYLRTFGAWAMLYLHLCYLVLARCCQYRYLGYGWCVSTEGRGKAPCVVWALERALRFFDAFQKITSDIILYKSQTNFGPWVINV